ncbi:sugar ABC transporter permease [Euhalothece natronophila Z-M001]|uniref:Sugar ABC transporter permease n=1 Tax=Euhalothece natronophila Z-M001 TaxID=522448 RepID=A0A5B8NIL1_9CHRO|nr:sugar ABC transporter permease [Euhalothece natronophila]QDZ38798.1 sugar ABC transporter permease [Euhalothece natronophila Z-M001]
MQTKKLNPWQWWDKETITAWLFLAPALFFLGVFVFYPITYLLYLSFTTGSFTQTGEQWVGLRNYLRLVVDPDFGQVIGNTIYFTLATVIPSVILPLIIAVLLNQSIALRGLLRTVYFLPSIISLVAVGLGFRWLFQNQGPINDLLINLGVDSINWLNNPSWAMPVLIILSTWQQIGFNMVVFLAGLQAIPQIRYDAAELDGANGLAKFLYVTLPGLRPTLLFTTIITLIFTLRSFEQVYVVTGGGPLNSTNILVYYIYEEAFARFDFGYAAAAATILLMVTLVLVYFQLRLRVDD